MSYYERSLFVVTIARALCSAGDIVARWMGHVIQRGPDVHDVTIAFDSGDDGYANGRPSILPDWVEKILRTVSWSWPKLKAPACCQY
jgi:hypothetical protein